MQARLFKTLHVYGPSPPATPQSGSDYETAEEGDTPEGPRRQNGRSQPSADSSPELDVLALPPGLSMAGPALHNLSDEVSSCKPVSHMSYCMAMCF